MKIRAEDIKAGDRLVPGGLVHTTECHWYLGNHAATVGANQSG